MALQSDAGISPVEQPCHYCETVDVGVAFTCGCRLCRKCSSDSFWAEACVKCGNRVNYQDKEAVDVLFKRFPMS